MKTIDAACDAAAELRGLLHRRPELAFEEVTTALAIQDFLGERGIAVTPRVGGTGVVARVEAERAGPARLYRADMDAIPLPRADGAPAGAQHGCGHDGHSAMLAGALAALAAAPDRWAGSVTGVFQPAEETGKGALAMLEHEALASAEFDRAYAIHNQPGIPAGVVGVAREVAAVASTGLKITVTGRATHASTPHRGNAAIPALAALVGELLALPSYVTPFGAAMLVTPTFFHAGPHQFGRVPSGGAIGLVLRSDDKHVLDRVLREGEQLIHAIAGAYELEVEVERIEPFPTTVNNPKVVDEAMEVLVEAGLSVAGRPRPQPWSEDFGYFLQRWPGALFLLGAGDDHASLHSKEYAFPDDLLRPGITLWTALAGLAPA